MRAPMLRALAAMIALILAATASLVLAQAPTPATVTVAGKVTNATAGSTLASDMVVQLHVIKSETEVETKSAPVGADGTYRFDNVAVLPNHSYLLVAQHQNVFYSAEFDPATETGPINLTVYDVTNTNERVDVLTSVVMLAGVDAKARMASFLEIHTIQNSGDHTFLPDLATPGVATLLRFSLPEGFTALEVQSPLPGGQLLEVDQGFAITVPVPPGQHDLMFSYQVPYVGSALEFKRSFPFATGSFRLLVPEKMATVQAEGLSAGGSTPIGGTAQQVFLGQNFPRNASVNVALLGLPQPSLVQRISGTLEGRVAIIGVATVAALALGGLLVYAVTKRRGPVRRALAIAPAGTPGAAMPAPLGNLVARMAELDDRFARGGLARAEYESERASLKAQLVEQRLREGGTV